MNTFLVLLRGINVGGKNKVSMAELRGYLEDLGCTNVATYINSGNVIVDSDKTAKALGQLIEDLLPQKFKLDSQLVKALVLTPKQLQKVVDDKPKGFGDQPDKYYSDAIFMMDITVADAMTAFSPREGVDQVWPGTGVIYSERLGAERTKSRLNRIMTTPYYKSMTIRSWNTTTKLLDILTK